ncbi:hypothetical protein [Yersinia phage fHe-Yen9-04]|uniref:Uncharacterized protein n=2 Tax=Eneladusvirus Yen904 TaxID=2560849 RepID=A0A2C9CXZ8_9CAUD|nr:hypothetical protein FDJ41_gp475 [Yersinia phage fHe-Yen9-04]SOK58705.1 hypothetical protein [Yersinia phage fHe-Yen9-04]SOK59239.1 hypothetical protein [Yersinia phage fHe-Yen9-03]VUE36474.1 hypothetical protein [Yersinia phage fHe-Yen9-04]
MKILFCWLIGAMSVILGMMFTAWRTATLPQGNLYFLSPDDRLLVSLWTGGLYCMWFIIVSFCLWLVFKGIDYAYE